MALYLMTSPHANMLGIYYIPVMYIAHETGLPFEGASKGLRRCIEGGFCAYDEASEVVWVYRMAAYQIEPRLKPTDNRVKSIAAEFLDLPKCQHIRGFYEMYREAFHLPEYACDPSPSEAPSKPLRSQEQEQEQEQEEKKGIHSAANLAAPPARAHAREAAPAAPRYGAHAEAVRSVIADFDSAIVEAWGDSRARAYPQAKDGQTALGWITEGISPELISVAIRGRLGVMAGSGQEPPGGLRYLDQAVRAAHADAARPRPTPQGAPHASADPARDRRAEVLEGVRRAGRLA